MPMSPSAQADFHCLPKRSAEGPSSQTSTGSITISATRYRSAVDVKGSITLNRSFAMGSWAPQIATAANAAKKPARKEFFNRELGGQRQGEASNPQ